MQKKKIAGAEATAQDFFNVEDIDNDFIFTKDGYLIGFLSVRAGDNKLLSEDEQLNKAESIAYALKGDGSEFQILSIPRTVDIQGMIASLYELRKSTSNDAKLKLINGEISALQDMTADGSKEPMIVVKLWQKAERGADAALNDRLTDIRSRLLDNMIPTERMRSKDIVYMGKVFADLSEYQESGEDMFGDIPILPSQSRNVTKRSETNDNIVLQNLLTPVGGIEFKNNRVTVGSAVGRIYGAMRYPSELDFGWAVEIMNLSNCITSITYYPGNSSALAEALSRSIKSSTTDANAERDARRKLRFEKQAEDAVQLIEDMDYKSMEIGHISVLAMPFASREEDLEDVCREVIGKFTRKKIKMRVLGNLQKEAYKQLSPYYTPQRVLDDVLKQIIPLSSLTGGFPMTVNTYRDDRGTYFARTYDGNIVSIDLDYRGSDRTNGNLVVAGEAGQGKSTALKHILQSRYMKGSKILVIDPEREYRSLCMRMNGAWLDVGAGATKINPLQIRPVPQEDEADGGGDDIYSANDNAMALHISTLEVFFSLAVPSLNDALKAVLKRELKELYNSFDIDWDTDVGTLDSSEFPLMEDLYNQIEKKSKKDEACRELALFIYDMALGANSFLWNGHTNVNIDSDFIVFDTNKLINAAEPVKRAQYFNTLSLCWEILSAERSQAVTLLSDETHICLDPAIPQTAMYLRNIAKRARKYEGSLMTSFQSISDMLYPEIRMAGQAILDNSTYKLLFGCDGKTLQDTERLFMLTAAEKNILLSRRRAKALLLMGGQHINISFDIPQYKLDLMGSGGGR